MDFLDIFSEGAFSDWAGEFLHGDMSKMTICFIIAARLHRGWVKKDIAEQMKVLTNSLGQIAEGFTLHSKKIDDLTTRVEHLESGKK